MSEDIGRHNAVDRVIGYGLRAGIDFSRTFVVSSGRISSEMVRKCLIANIPVIISRSATTTLSVEIAEKTGLTIVGFVRAGKMNIYTHPRRISGTGSVPGLSSSQLTAEGAHTWQRSLLEGSPQARQVRSGAENDRAHTGILNLLFTLHKIEHRPGMLMFKTRKHRPDLPPQCIPCVWALR